MGSAPAYVDATTFLVTIALLGACLIGVIAAFAYYVRESNRAMREMHRQYMHEKRTLNIMLMSKGSQEYAQVSSALLNAEAKRSQGLPVEAQVFEAMRTRYNPHPEE